MAMGFNSYSFLWNMGGHDEYAATSDPNIPEPTVFDADANQLG